MKINALSKLILCSILVLRCFGDESHEEKKNGQKEPITKESSNLGWFFGVGLGGGLDKLTNAPDVRKNNAKIYYNFAGIATAKAGGYYYFHPSLGMRYYYSFDLSMDLGYERDYRVGHKFGIALSSQTHMLNFDLLFNAYTKEKNAFDLIFGLGFGASITRRDEIFEDFSYSLVYGRDTNFLLDLQTRANLGMRWMHNQTYGLELMTKIPLTPARQIDPSGGRDPVWEFLRYSRYFSLTLDFVMEL